MASTVVGALCQWLVVVSIARLGDATQLGYYSLAVAILGPTVMLTRLNMRTVLATDARERHTFADYFTVRLVLSLLGSVVVVAYGFAERMDKQMLLVLLAVIALKAIESQADIVHGALQRQSKFQAISWSVIMRGVSLLATVVAGFILTNTLLVGLAAGIAIWLLVLFAYDFRRLENRSINWLTSDGRSTTKLAWECLPSGAVMMLASLNMNAPLYAVNHVLGVEAAGRYAAVAYFFTVGGLIAASMTQSAAGHMATFFFDDRARFWMLLRKFLIYSSFIVLIALSIAWLFGKPLLVMAYVADNADLHELLHWVALASGLSIPAAFLGLALTIARLFWIELALTLISVAIVGLTALWWVPVWGLSGAAMALTAGIASRAILSMAALRLVNPKSGDHHADKR